MSETRFVFGNIIYSVGERVIVYDHYAGYKSNYFFIFGELYLSNGIPMIKIEIDPLDIEQINGIQLACFGEIIKINNLQMTKKEFENHKDPLGMIISLDPETGKIMYDTYPFGTVDAFLEDFKRDFPNMIHLSTRNKAYIKKRKEAHGIHE